MFAAAAGLLLLDELLLLPHPAASTPASRATATIDTTAMDIRLVRDDHRSMLPPLGHGSGCDWVACGWIPRPRAANPAPLAWRRPRWGSSVRKGRDASLESGGGANNTHAARFTSPFRVSVASPVRCLAPARRAAAVGCRSCASHATSAARAGRTDVASSRRVEARHGVPAAFAADVGRASAEGRFAGFRVGLRPHETPAPERKQGGR